MKVAAEADVATEREAVAVVEATDFQDAAQAVKTVTIVMAEIAVFLARARVMMDAAAVATLPMTDILITEIITDLLVADLHVVHLHVVELVIHHCTESPPLAQVLLAVITIILQLATVGLPLPVFTIMFVIEWIAFHPQVNCPETKFLSGLKALVDEEFLQVVMS